MWRGLTFKFIMCLLPLALVFFWCVRHESRFKLFFKLLDGLWSFLFNYTFHFCEQNRKSLVLVAAWIGRETRMEHGREFGRPMDLRWVDNPIIYCDIFFGIKIRLVPAWSPTIRYGLAIAHVCTLFHPTIDRGIATLDVPMWSQRIAAGQFRCDRAPVVDRFCYQRPGNLEIWRHLQVSDSLKFVHTTLC